ncbi:hypothetical protein [Otariodibacter sp.]|uniref:hypothetical protein n=1 Tax=Otariodibacter sp. TaxID=3030919 RepID=UPI00262B116F|nr:hypothetical protein [Otariodibacter sp.]
MQKNPKLVLLIFPLLTQIILSLFLPFFGGINVEGLRDVFVLATIPTFLFAIVCVVQKYHQRNLIQIAFFSGIVMFLYSIITISVYADEAISGWENSLAIVLYALMFALPSSVYALIILRLFLPKK